MLYYTVNKNIKNTIFYILISYAKPYQIITQYIDKPWLKYGIFIFLLKSAIKQEL